MDTRIGEFVGLGMEEIAVEWLEENGISYHQDLAETGE